MEKVEQTMRADLCKSVCFPGIFFPNRKRKKQHNLNKQDNKQLTNTLTGKIYD